MRFWPYQLPIPRGARVLEIGSGGRPHHRSTVLVDRFVHDPAEREGRDLVHDARPLVAADGCALPFRDRSFDYCICMHVLEHVEHPELLLQEMQRVARAGYIETPSPLFEFLFNVPPYTDIHRWFVARVKGELVLTKKTAENSSNPFARTLDTARRTNPHLERWMEKNPHLFTTQFHWNGNIGFCFSDTVPFDTLLQEAKTAEPYFWGSGLWGLKRWVYSIGVHPRLRKGLKHLLG